MNIRSRTVDQPIETAVSVAGNADLMTSVARLYYLERLGQSEIASIYGVSRSTVSRMLRSARDLGIVRISVDEYDPRDRELEHRLRERFDLRRVIVGRAIEGSDLSTRRALGYFAAPDVEGWIAESRAVGVAGGRALSELLRSIGHRQQPQDLQVVQLMGMIGSSPSSVDASELSRALASRFHGEFHTISAPAYVGAPHTRDVFLSHPQIRAVWSRFSTLDLAFVGIGTLEASVFVDRDVLDANDLAQARRAGAVGEICGHFFDSSGRECATPLRERVVSIGLDTLRDCKEVIAVTTGADRAAAVRAAIAGRLVHSLILDDAAARAVLGDR